jgi:hypothetical protein
MPLTLERGIEVPESRAILLALADAFEQADTGSIFRARMRLQERRAASLARAEGTPRRECLRREWDDALEVFGRRYDHL